MRAINLEEEANRIETLFEYHTIARMNDHTFTLVKAEDRTLDFHTHPSSDEVFFIVDGTMKLEFEDEVIELKAGEMCVVPGGVLHRPICEGEVTAMLIEIDGTLSPDNPGGAYHE